MNPYRTEIVEEARRKASEVCAALGVREHAACLVYAAEVVRAAQKRGTRIIVQAGSCSWPRLREDQDDGVSPTHFSYVWEPRKVPRYLRMGVLPEMHAWAADPESMEIIDLTTGMWPAQCLALIGADWPGDPPPDYLWSQVRDIPDRVHYLVDREATFLAMRLIRDLYSGRRLHD